MKDLLNKNNRQKTPEKIIKFRESKNNQKKFSPSEKKNCSDFKNSSEKNFLYGKKSIKSEKISSLLNFENCEKISSIQNFVKTDNIINPSEKEIIYKFSKKNFSKKKKIDNIFGKNLNFENNENLDFNKNENLAYNFFLENSYKRKTNKISEKNFENFFSKNEIEKFLEHSRIKLTFWQFDKIWENCQKKKNNSSSLKEFINKGFSMKLIHK